MAIIIKLKQILDHLNVRNHTTVAQDICEAYGQPNGHMIYYELFDHNTEFVPQNQSQNQLQTGGSSIVFKYGGEEFKFFKYHEKHGAMFSMHKNCNRDLMPECIIINVDKKRQNAYINGISYDNDCFQPNSKQKSGSTLLKIALHFIDKIKDDYKLKYVYLNDTSTKYCKKTGKKIKLWALSMLTRGHTWYNSFNFNFSKLKNSRIICFENKLLYSSHDFVPFDFDREMAHMENVKKYIANQTIVSETKVKDTNFKHIFKKGFEKAGLLVKKKTLDQFFEEYNDEYIVDFFSNYMEVFDKTCDVFGFIYDDIIYDLKLHDLSGMSYYKTV